MEVKRYSSGLEQAYGGGRKHKENFIEELRACQHYRVHFLLDTEMKNERHKVFNFEMSKLVTKIINETLEINFTKLFSAAKISFAGEYRYYHPYENNNLF